ncbi:MAG TPA: hypothetical protein PK156_08700 [Polyangium sp.]|nr:hypothetical protein [Polyangium sp.]
MNWPEPTRDDLRGLEEKYAQLESLRQARERGEPIPERAVFKRLAERYPGVLRELDTLPMEVIQRRREQLELATNGGVVEPWMRWMVAYHALLRMALWVKMRTAKDPSVTAERMVFLVRRLEEEFGFGVDESFVRDVARPRGGRINHVVLGRLAGMFGVTVGDLRGSLFGGSKCGANVVIAGIGDGADDGEFA